MVVSAKKSAMAASKVSSQAEKAADEVMGVCTTLTSRSVICILTILDE